MNEVKPKIACIGGKFNSIGSANQQAENAALVSRLSREVGVDGYTLLVASGDLTAQVFLDDTRFKLQQERPQFGWRQVQRMVEIHAKVVGMRAAK